MGLGDGPLGMGACCASKMAWVQIPIIHIKLCVCSLVIERTETGRSLGSLASQRHWTIEVQGQWETLRLKEGGEWAIEEIPNVLVWPPCMCAYAWLRAMVLSSSSRRSCALWPLWAPGMQCTQVHSGKALLHIKKKKWNEHKKSKLKAKISMTSPPFLRPCSQFRFRQCASSPLWSGRGIQSTHFSTLTFSDAPASPEEMPLETGWGTFLFL